MSADANVPVIAIDGPAASGKGTIAHRVAQVLGFRYLDSGSLYRVVGLEALRSGIAPDDERALTEAAQRLDVRFDGERIFLGGEEVTDSIRSEGVAVAASQVAVHSGVRHALLSRQRAFRRPPGVVAEGRDMGTVVFPEAILKVFVVASAEERALRRYKQLIEKGKPATLDDLLRDIQERDSRDSARVTAPLKPAADALILDTTNMTVAASVDFVLQRYRATIAAHGG